MRPALAVLITACLSLALPAAAQTLDLGANGRGDEPIEVLADNGIEWQQGDQRFVARGNAEANRGDVTLRADELVAFYTEQAAGEEEAGDGGGDSQITRLEAHGNVRITSPTEQATGDDAVYEVAEGRIVLTGNPVRLTTPDQILTAGSRLVYDVVNKRAVAEGGATLEQAARTLRGDTLVAHLREVGGKTELSSVDARGSVTITTETETARGSQGNYNAKTGIATLTGSVTLTRGPNVLTGAKAVVNMHTGVSTLYGNGGASGGKARAVLVPDQAPADQTPVDRAPGTQQQQ